ncbi:YiiD C-terminal domain-containing protein [Bdellovibrio sp.]|uniref:YiiD C-terminal domain-containing protein n=1 Tax=Bdellovibrio sp. TaxID=28201 RepID=UPI0039E5782F
MEVDSQELIRILKDKIVLYQHLGIEVVKIDSHEVRFKVSLEKNKNHKGTAFGGSLYATGVLASYALVLAGLHERHIPTENIVIAKGEIQYLRPVDTDFEVVCQFSSLEEEDQFFAELNTKGKVRGALATRILGADGVLKATLMGVFVVKK